MCRRGSLTTNYSWEAAIFSLPVFFFVLILLKGDARLVPWSSPFHLFLFVVLLIRINGFSDFKEIHRLLLTM